MKWFAIMSMLVIAGCSRAPADQARLDSIEVQLSSLKAEVEQLRQKSPPPPPSPPHAELEVSDGAQHFSRPFVDMSACESAMRLALAENDKRETERQAQNAANPNFQVLGIVRVSAYCIPLS